ncbi:hypothetical protein B2K_39525 [Paenibacillus mucilaginosus K02]|uniref:Uncharacterized protein n=1 Tax=Paenibacillus mucilaginosus K02 TaxID=997761 RepID=R9UPG5_9BACL|nr:hypothetical protein B2K_39525 [Paenibacillus mucilaginosus K02]
MGDFARSQTRHWHEKKLYTDNFDYSAKTVSVIGTGGKIT